MVKCGEKGAFLIRKKGIDQHKTGHGLEIEFDHVDPPRNRGQAPTFGDKHDQQQTPPEDGHRETSHSGTHQGVIEPAPPFDSSDNARRNTNDDREQHSRESQFERCREQGEKFCQHLFACRERCAEIAMQQLPDIIDELLPHRLIKPQFVTKISEALC